MSMMSDDGIAPAKSVQHDARRSSVADVFGGAAIRKASQRRVHTESSSTALCTVPSIVAAEVKPLFQFRSHVVVREASRSHKLDTQDNINGSPNNLIGRATSQVFDDQKKRDREERKSIVHSALVTDSLSHLVIETRKEKLVLPAGDADEAASPGGELTLARTATDSTFVAFSDGAAADDPDALWEHVRNTNQTEKQRQKQTCETTRNKLDPRWWRHLSLRDFSEFLTPGLFDDRDLELTSDSDADSVNPLGHKKRPDSQPAGGNSASSPTIHQHDSLNVMSATTLEGPDSSRHGIAARSSSHIIPRKPQVPLHIHQLLVSAWTQHINNRAASHWLTPRRHGVHGGKSMAELGTLTTICSRDFVAMANSLTGVCQAVERVSRLTVEQEEQSMFALCFQSFLMHRKEKLHPSIDALVFLSVAETQDREDIMDEAQMTLEWNLLTSVFVPCQIAIAETERDKAVEMYLKVQREKMLRDAKSVARSDVESRPSPESEARRVKMDEILESMR